MDKKFWSRVDIQHPDECWIWTGALIRGYGRYYIKGKHVITHRYAYDMVYGIKNESNDIHHSCNNPSCCNPHHLEEVTRKENIRAKSTYNKHRYPCGHLRTQKNTYTYGKSNHCVACHQEYKRK